MAKPRKPLERVRKICLGFAETTEKEAWGAPTFRVQKKMFAMFVNNHHDDGRVGWIGVRLDVDVDWSEVAELVEDSYRMSAPKKLLAMLDG